MTTHIRPAETRDFQRICQLLGLLFEQEAEFVADYPTQEVGVKAILQNPERGIFLVIENEGIVVGTACLQYLISTALGGKVALLEDFIVEPAQRGLGLGRKLLQFSLDHARAAGCRRITVLTDGDNQKAKALYQSLGFCASSMLPLRLHFADNNSLTI